MNNSNKSFEEKKDLDTQEKYIFEQIEEEYENQDLKNERKKQFNKFTKKIMRH